MSSDRYDELMARRHELELALHERMRRHHEDMSREMAQLGPAAKSFGSRTNGIRLASDGSLDAILELTDVRGRTSTVVLQANPDGRVVELGAQSEPDSAPQPRPRGGDETEARLELVRSLAMEHLPEEVGKGFLDLLRPALRLEHAAEGDAVVAQLGGLPRLPMNSWPVWNEHGPLSHVLTFDCASVRGLLPELAIPDAGSLAFFYFEGSFDDYASTVGTWDPATRPGFRVLHIRPDQAAPHDRLDLATPTPPGLTAYPMVPLTAVRTLTWPARDSLIAEAFWNSVGLAVEDSHGVEELYEALHNIPQGGYDTHQIGGYAYPQQGAVELEVEQLRHGLEGAPFDWNDAAVHEAASRWQLLLQVASDDSAQMMWGDVGQLYYLAQDLADPEQALFTWQCG